MPRLSIIIPCFNERPDVLRASLESVRAQGFEDFECLVVDESTDAASAEACRLFCAADLRFRYVRPERRLGLAASLNLGIAESGGELIARFDSDDLCDPGRMEAQVAFLEARPDVGVLGGQLAVIDDAGRPIGIQRYPLEHDEIERRFHLTTGIAHPTVMMRRAVLGSAGVYDPAFRYAEDLDLWLRLLNAGVRFANLDSVLVQYRQQTNRRSSEHWRYNLRARRRNFRARMWPRRGLGIAAVAAWSAVPGSLQERLFARIRYSGEGAR